MSDIPAGHVSGFAAIIGRPNVGKSTLLNALIGQKLAIMSDKPQTTRNRIVGVLTEPAYQIVFLDTPGIHKPKHKLGEYMNRVAEHAIPDVDTVLFVVDATAKVGETDAAIAQRIKASGRKAILVVNKIDEMHDKAQMYAAMEAYKALGEFIEVIPISALKQRHLADLVDTIKKQLEPGPRYYPEDMVTDQPERMVAAELIREKILHLTRDEIPHSVAVEIEEMKTRENGVVYIRCTVWVERESQRGILVGEGGAMSREIGKLARADIEGLLGSKVYLELWVKAKKDWRNKDALLRSLGYREQ